MPAARRSAAAEETKRRTVATDAHEVERPEGQPVPNARPTKSTSVVGGDDASLGDDGRMPGTAEIDWNAIFRTIEGHGAEDGSGAVPFAYAPPQPGGYQEAGMAGPSRQRLAPIQVQPYSIDELLESQPSQQWAHDPFRQALGNGPPPSNDSPLDLAGPISPNRSQSYPCQNFPSDYHNLPASFGISSSRDPNEMLPPPIPPFGFPLNIEPFSTSSSSPVFHGGSSGYDHVPIPSVPQGQFDRFQQNQSTMQPPPNPGGPSTYTPHILSRQNSQTISPAPTPLSNPPSSEDAEDKRGRNTAASAKFRAKKKDAIANVQRTISELEVQHAGLEADVASLRSENGLLREMVQIKFGTSIPKN